MSKKQFVSGIGVKLLVVAACFAASFSVNAQQAEPINPPIAAAATNKAPGPLTTNEDERYRIGPGDILDIRILNRPTISRDAVRVEGNGVIRMPLIDEEIQAACKTEGELAKEIAEKYTKFYRKPQVDVFIKEYHSRQVAVIGAVNEQSRFELQRRIRLLDLLTYAKGTSAKAGQTINIVHAPRVQGCQKPGDAADDAAFSSYRLSDTLQGDPRANPYIEAGDIITVPEANQVYVVGNVYTPLTIPLKEPITLSRAVAMAGGVKQDSKKDKVRIVRQEPGAATSREIVVDLTAIEKKRADDVALMPNDIIDVPSSGSKSFLRGLLGTVAPSVAQLPVRIVP
jgi:polysaccharide export outer membrane protein